MQFNLPKTSFLQALQNSSGVASNKAQVPILGAVVVSSEITGMVFLHATDLTVFLREGLEADVTLAGQVAVDAGFLLQVVKSLPDGNLSVQLDGKKLLLEVGKAKVAIDSVISPKDFPNWPTESPEAINTMPGALLAEIFSAVSPGAAKDVSRGQLCGVNVQFTESGGLVAETFNGHMAMRGIFAGEGAAIVSGVLPVKGIDILAKLAKKAGEVIMAMGNKFLIANVGTITLVIARHQGDQTFPNLAKVWPPQGATSLCLPSKELTQAIRLAMTCSRNGSVDLSLQNGIEVSSGTDKGSVTHELSGVFEGPGLKIRAVGQYLIDCLQGPWESSQLGFDGPLGYIRVNSNASEWSLNALVSPMRVQ